MQKVTINFKERRPYKWNADKTVHVSVDGVVFGSYWDKSIEFLLKKARKTLNVKRVKSEVIYG